MHSEKQKLLDAIVSIEGQRLLLGDAVVDAALESLKQSLAQFENTNAVTQLHSDSPLEGERKLVTIMFADFSNFTAMSERMDAEDVRAVMNTCFSLLVPIVEQYGGVVDKFIGDEIMALFGAPRAHDNDAECALRAALDMMKALEGFNSQNNTNLGLHFGINTGVVIAGGVGSTERQQYSVIGDPVNLAARLEDASVTGEILVGHSTYSLTAALFEFEERAAISVKGKAKPIPLFRLLGVKKTPQLQRGIAGLSSEMVGREAPFQFLLECIDNLKNNQGKVIALVAEPGLGKSRMLSELKRATSYTYWLEGRGISFAQNISYGVAKNMLDNALNVPANITTDVVGTVLLEQLRTWDAQQAPHLYPYLARLRDIGLDTETDSLISAVVPEVMQQRMRQAFSDFLILKTQSQPTVLVWEDLHWSDTSSLQLIEYLFQTVSDKPLLLILSFRPQEGLIQDFYRRWIETNLDFQVVVLSPLTESESELLIGNLLKIKNLPNKTRAVLLQKSEGNPFYLEELIRSLLDSGMLFWEGNDIHIKGEIGEIHIPNTLQGVIEARIDRLRTEDKITLQTASVIGRIFGKQVLEYLIENQKRDIVLNSTLINLQDRELIRQQILYEYIFKHAITQDVTYNSLLLARRRELHQYAAEAIESLFKNQEGDLAYVLAWHYQRAQNHEKAALQLTLAADKSRNTFSYNEAKNYYVEALKELEYVQENQWQQKTAILENLGEVLVALIQFEEARQTYQKALVMVPDSEIITQARLNRKLGESYAPQRRPDQELLYFDIAIEKLENADNRIEITWQYEWLEIHLARIWSFYWLNQVANMRDTLETVQKKCEQSGTLRQQAIWHGRWMLYITRSQQYVVLPTQVWHIEKALDLSYQSQDYKQIVFHLGQSGMVYLYAQNIEKAEARLLEAIELGDKIGDIQHQVVCLQFLNHTYIKTNNIEGVKKYALIMEEKIKGRVPFYMFSVLGCYCWIAFKENNWVESEKYGVEALKIHNKAPVPNAYVKWILADIYITQSRYDEAIAHMKDILLPYQFKVPEEFAQKMHYAFGIWEKGVYKTAEQELKYVLELAQNHHYY